ncbi:esterase [Bordetella ansorpii]|uniref:Esterase n=1 Tax=Bordetella ansorpii TaxID=288768 RepID=A0A157QUE6_9BORD|nr:alpha/beta hydrolase [Bordetella ansorpii]SAI48559.1 esterase [Bordetella ansorpii]
MSLVHRQFDAATLDVQYNARATVPHVESILKQYANESRQARDTLPCALNLAYGDHTDETLDVFPAARGLPAPGCPAPVFIYLHGGYWRALGKDDSSSMAPAFTLAGAVVVAVNYSLAPAVTLDRIVDQVRRAVAWVHRNIATHGGDPARLHVGGSSAGGHLCGMLLAGGWQRELGLPGDAIKGALLLSGLYDLTPLVHTHINQWMRMTPADAARNSPGRLAPAHGCPIVVSYGENETDEFKRQSNDYLHAWQARGFPGRYVPAPGLNHFDIVLDLGRPGSLLAQAMFDQMGLSRTGQPDTGRPFSSRTAP